MDCDHCDETFSSELARIEHALEAHGDELTSHDRDDLKRRRNKLERDADGGAGPVSRSTLKLAGFAVAGLALVAAAGFGLSMTGMVSFSTSGGGSNVDTTLGGPTHEHALFSVVVNGQQIDFSQRQYQVQSQDIHFEGGDGTQIHKHTQGTTIAYALETLGMTINETCLATQTDTYCESDGGDLTVTAGGADVDPQDYVVQDGVPIRIEYAN